LDFEDVTNNNVSWMNDFFLSISSACDLFTALVKCIEFEELIFLLVIVV